MGDLWDRFSIYEIDFEGFLGAGYQSRPAPCSARIELKDKKEKRPLQHVDAVWFQLEPFEKFSKWEQNDAIEAVWFCSHHVDTFSVFCFFWWFVTTSASVWNSNKHFEIAGSQNGFSVFREDQAREDSVIFGLFQVVGNQVRALFMWSLQHFDLIWT